MLRPCRSKPLHMGCGGSVPVKVKGLAGSQDHCPPSSVKFPAVNSIEEHYAIEDELRRGAPNLPVTSMPTCACLLVLVLGHGGCGSRWPMSNL